MIRWRDEGILLAVRKHGETAAIVELFTAAHGLAAGVVRGGAGRRMAPVLQPGAQLAVEWSARLEAHLGHFTVEPERSRVAKVMGDRQALAGLNAVCAMLRFALAEREPHAGLYARSRAILDLLGQGDLWPLAYLQWELALLEEAGFGLDLSACAVTGVREGLRYVSPRSGRAVSAAGAGAWADRLLPLPGVMLGQGGDDAGIREGLRVTGWFWEHKVAPALSRRLPAARARLIQSL